MEEFFIKNQLGCAFCFSLPCLLGLKISLDGLAFHLLKTLFPVGFLVLLVTYFISLAIKCDAKIDITQNYKDLRIPLKSDDRKVTHKQKVSYLQLSERIFIAHNLPGGIAAFYLKVQ